MMRDLQLRRQLLTHVAARVVSPRDRLREQAQRCDELHARLGRAMQGRLERRRASLEQLMAKLDALSPLRVLERGYAITRDPATGSLVRSATQVVKGQTLEIGFHDGKVPVQAL